MTISPLILLAEISSTVCNECGDQGHWNLCTSGGGGHKAKVPPPSLQLAALAVSQLLSLLELQQPRVGKRCNFSTSLAE